MTNQDPRQKLFVALDLASLDEAERLVARLGDTVTHYKIGYRLGYAESADGVRWERLDHLAGMERSDEGWDSVMIAYPFVYEHRGVKHLLYNGNGFGETGIGYAVLDEDDRAAGGGRA